MSGDDLDDDLEESRRGPPSPAERDPEAAAEGEEEEFDAETPQERRAKERTNLPGALLIVTGCCNLLGFFLCLSTVFQTVRMTKDEFEFTQKQASELFPRLASPPGQVPYEVMKVQMVAVYGLGAVLSLASGFLALLAGARMRHLQSYPLCVAGAVAALIPCVSVASCPCVFGLAVGIWALFVLHDAEVKAAFW